MQVTKLNLQDVLPLTCSRSGTCCHGKKVLLSPWELHCIAKEKKISAREFRDTYFEAGGVQLTFNGALSYKGEAACSQYVENFGCSVHNGRPLACRMYPLGRQIQHNTVQYMHEGPKFPCLEECKEVLDLPQLSVADYLKGQQTEKFENAQDAYLELMQNIADIAFELLLDSGLSESGDTKTLAVWRQMGDELPGTIAERIGAEWLDCLTLPEIKNITEDPLTFITEHYEIIQTKAQEKFGALTTLQELHEASVLLMGIALLLAKGIGANPTELANHWADIAKSHGALEE